MQQVSTLTQAYNKLVKRIKTFTMVGEFVIFIIRVLAQRIFSVYIGIVLFQFILVTQMSFKTYSIIESKFYLIMNCILFYLLVINFIQSEINQVDTIQYVLKDKYIIDYVKIGYPIQFCFRVMATLLMWRVYQYSKMKTIEYGDIQNSDQTESNNHREDRIRVRENSHDEDGLWALNIRHNDSIDERNSNNTSRNIPPNILNQRVNQSPVYSEQRNNNLNSNRSSQFRTGSAQNTFSRYGHQPHRQQERQLFSQHPQINQNLIYNQPFQRFHQEMPINQNPTYNFNSQQRNRNFLVSTINLRTD